MDTWTAAWVVSAAILLPGMPIRAQSDSGIRAGVARVDVKPPLPAPYDLLQAATEVAHPLYARVVYLEDENDQVVLVAIDCEGILRTAHDMLRTAIAEATGVSKQCVVVGANHSHNAQWLNLDMDDLLAPHGLRQVNKRHFRETVTKVAEAAREAKQSRRPITVSAGSAQLSDSCASIDSTAVRRQS